MSAAAPANRLFPWDDAMSFGFAVLRLSSREFWAMTPRELAIAMKPFQNGHGPLSRTELDDLLGRFPDEVEALCQP